MDNQPQPQPGLPDSNNSVPNPQSPFPDSAQPASVASPDRSERLTVISILLVVVLIIAITGVLAALYSSTHKKGGQSQSNSSASSPQSRAATLRNKHNASRQTDIQALQTQLEAYFSQNGFYPSLSDMNSPSWRATYIKTLNPAALVDPLSLCDPVTAECLLTAPAAKAYSYQVQDSQGNDCENDDMQCAKYTLTATYEGTVNGATTFTKSNLD